MHSAIDSARKRRSGTAVAASLGPCPARGWLSVQLVGLLLGGALLPAQASEVDGLKLARDNACLACHQVDARRVGPPFLAIGERYTQEAGADAPESNAGAEAATTYLADAIQQGGRGRWGAIPMPAQPQVSAEDAQQLAQWILALPDNARE